MTGERVAILATNQDALLYQIAYFATQKAGGVAAPINPRLARREVACILENARPRVLIAAGDQLARALDLTAGLADPPVVVSPEIGAPHAWGPLEANDDDTFQVPVTSSDLADIVYTSGTTGLPKGVASTHDNVLHIAVTPSEREDALLHAAPLATALGTYGAMIASLRLGFTNICLPSFVTARFAQLIDIHRPGWLMVVPAQVLLLREAGVLEGLDTSSVWMVVFSTAPMPPEATRWLAATFPRAMLVNAYGLTEAGDAACLLPPGEAEQRPGSVGKPIEGAGVRVVDNHGKGLDANHVGELFDPDRRRPALLLRRTRKFRRNLAGRVGAHRGPGLPRRRRIRLRRGPQEGHDHPRRLQHLLDRGGERPLRAPGDCGSRRAGRPHQILGQDILAVVRLAQGASLDIDALHVFLADRLADYKHPNRMVINQDPLPRTSLDKVDKLALRAELELDPPDASQGPS